MRICIDSCVFIHGLQESDLHCANLLDVINPELELIIPRLIAREVSRNLNTDEQRRAFYRLFHERTFAVIQDISIPRELVEKYVGSGLPEKADAYIGAFTELIQADYLISVNRHFLKELHTKNFEVITPALFIKRWQSSKR